MDDRLTRATGRAVRDRRRTGHPGLAHDQAPPLLERRERHHPGLLVDLSLALLVDVPGEDDGVTGSALGRVAVQVLLPPSAADDRELQTGKVITQSQRRIDRMLDLLVVDAGGL